MLAILCVAPQEAQAEALSDGVSRVPGVVVVGLCDPHQTQQMTRLVGATLIVTPEGTVIPDNAIVMGTPGKVTRLADNRVKNRFNAYMYTANARAYAAGNHRLWADPAFQAAAKAELARLTALFADGAG